MPYINDKNDTMEFIRTYSDTTFSIGKYKIPSPTISDNTIFIKPSSLDLVIMPCVAISKNGYRVGMGRAYYDKTFNFENRPKLIAACYSFQIIADFTPEAWDIRSDDHIVV